MINQRNSGSAGDVRTTSTESDVNSADESGRLGMEVGTPNFRLPKAKKVSSGVACSSKQKIFRLKR